MGGPSPTTSVAGAGAVVDRNGLVVLDRAECLRLLGERTFGRIAVTIGALPSILPVNYRLVDGAVVFRTSEGSKLDAATSGAVVAFEVDGVDPRARAGWSVLVTGVASEVTDPADLHRVAEADVPRWTRGRSERVVAVPATMVSGRVLVPGLGWEDQHDPGLVVAALRVDRTVAPRRGLR